MACYLQLTYGLLPRSYAIALDRPIESCEQPGMLSLTQMHCSDPERKRQPGFWA